MKHKVNKKLKDNHPQEKYFLVNFKPHSYLKATISKPTTSVMFIQKPHPQDYPNFYATYIDFIDGDVIKELENQNTNFYRFIKNLPAEKEEYRYAEGKWSAKEVIGHVLEVERIMTYRALAISRADQQSLPGMDENNYIVNSNYSNQRVDDLAEEFLHLRKANIYLFKSFSQEMLSRKGIANGNPITVAALVYIIAGHLAHHTQVLNERYLAAV